MQFLKTLKIPPEISIFLGWILAIHLMELIILPSQVIPTQLLSNLTLTERLINIWSSSADTAHYLLIAQNGYEFGNKTLFPLWPIILKVIGPNPLSAKIISMFLTFAFLLVLIKIIKHIDYNKYTEIIVLSLIAFPASFMLLSPMSEPLYLLMAATTIFFTEKKIFHFRGNAPIAVTSADLTYAHYENFGIALACAIDPVMTTKRLAQMNLKLPTHPSG